MGSFRGQPKSILYESMPGKVLSGSPSSLFASLSGWPMSILRSTRSSHILPLGRILAFSQAAESNDLLLPHAANKQTNAVTTQPVILRRTRVLIMAHSLRGWSSKGILTALSRPRYEQALHSHKWNVKASDCLQKRVALRWSCIYWYEHRDTKLRPASALVPQLRLSPLSWTG